MPQFKALRRPRAVRGPRHWFWCPKPLSPMAWAIGAPWSPRPMNPTLAVCWLVVMIWFSF